jgi:hypothetical protein
MSIQPFSPDPTEAAGPANGDGRHDFDFLYGRWRLAHRRLQRRLENDTQWDHFAGLSEVKPLLGGLGNVDDNVIELPSGTYRGSSLRRFDPDNRLWSIWWLDSRFPRLEPPVVGRFEQGVGSFFADDSLRGRPIRVRFIWSEITANSARWEQAFSPDGGETWEVNWINTLARIA